MTLTREEAQESKEMETLRVHADALLSLSSPAASSPDTSKPTTTPSSTTTPAARRALAAEGVFECKTCSKRFSSFQALGGHRTSHTRLQARMLLQQEPSADHGAADRDRNRVHECAVCGLEFSMGQALGGHMRRHRGETTSTAAPGDDSGSHHPLFDLNYPPVEDRSGDGQESSSAHRASDHPLLDLLV
ncbi:zinc finger protein ZAT18-like [Lolium rigidum]|uniref:zinc finger protein ZAT18-like n=1 Tax=Lolium rigidum TaxID=89674 RepID=UPI001F5DA7BB|nr:zinc finger protein ZAT18-like [Lolium rigidum]